MVSHCLFLAQDNEFPSDLDSFFILISFAQVRASPDQLVVIPHCLIERPWNALEESPLFVLPVAFSSLDESVEILLRRNIDRGEY